MSIADITNSIQETLDEMTGMANIAYLPSGFTTVKTALKTLATQKKDWNIEILEDGSEFTVDFEKQLMITIPKEHWDNFNTDFGSSLESGICYLGSYLNEAMDDKINKLIVEFKSELNKMLTKDPFKTVRQQVVKWIATFPKHGFGTIENCLVSYNTANKNIQSLTENILRAYGDDAGYMEMLITSIKEKRPLNAFDIFKDSDYIYCGTVKSVFENVHMTYETHVNLAFKVDASIYIDNMDVVDEVVGSKPVKAVRNVIYPMGSKFEKRFFKEIKDTIEDLS